MHIWGHHQPSLHRGTHSVSDRLSELIEASKMLTRSFLELPKGHLQCTYYDWRSQGHVPGSL